MKRLDIIDVKRDIKEGFVRLVFRNGNVLLVDNVSGEAVKIGELPMKGGDNT
jgi:hypothetical protein